MALHKTTKYLINVNRIPAGVAVAISSRASYKTIMQGVGAWEQVQGILTGKFKLSQADIAEVKKLCDAA
jgi:hypothetical protein